MGTIIPFSKTDGTTNSAERGKLHTDTERNAYLTNVYANAVRGKRLKIAREAESIAREIETRRERLIESHERQKDAAKAQEIGEQIEVVNRALELWCDEIAMVVDTLRDEVAAQIEREYGASARAFAAKLRDGKPSEIGHGYFS